MLIADGNILKGLTIVERIEPATTIAVRIAVK
jgi:hypothetical protein